MTNTEPITHLGNRDVPLGEIVEQNYRHSFPTRSLAEFTASVAQVGIWSRCYCGRPGRATPGARPTP